MFFTTDKSRWKQQRRTCQPSFEAGLTLCVITCLSLFPSAVAVAVAVDETNHSSHLRMAAKSNAGLSRTKNGVEVGVIKDGHATIVHRPSSPLEGPYKVGQNVTDRCEWLWQEFEAVTAWIEPDIRADRYHHQATDPGTYFRATSHIFWKDFVRGNWSQSLLPIDNEYRKYTWVLGDLHLLNFGSWKNRRGDIVFGMNDYDEGTIHDFQVDIMRLAISIYDHTQELMGIETACRVVQEFLKAYVSTVESYIGNEEALTADLTLETTTGPLRNFLQTVEDDEEYSRASQIKKYAKFKGGRWKFKAGSLEEPEHKLVGLDAETKAKIQAAFSGIEFGATLSRFVGFGRWNEESFQVLDVASRVNTGVGSFGVDRYFVLVSCGSCNEEGMVILDVKYQPPGSFRSVLSDYDDAWFDQHFAHDGSRVTEANRKLTAYTDPWTGWIVLDDDRPFSVRERSSWKEDFDVATLQHESALVVFVKELGMSVATSHVRGNVADAPDDFKNNIRELLGDAMKFQVWNDAVIDTASAYHDQVQVDFECFRNRVELHYPRNTHGHQR